jgi:hypothetical protein
MGITNANFNRIINLKLNPAGNSKAAVPGEMRTPTYIKCPVHGRKPNIEINGTWTTDVDLPAFNITIKNLYQDLSKEQYTSVEVEVGYEGNTISIKGDIITMYQESPGPEGKTVIQCVYGRMQQWLDAHVNLNFPAGTQLSVVLGNILNAIKADNLLLGKRAQTLSLKEQLQFTGTARDALTRLTNIFQDDKLTLTMKGTELRAICVTKGDFVEAPLILEYMSAPPQENAGDDAGSYYTTVTAPWMPKLSIGNLLTIPSRVYIRNFATVGGSAKTQNIQVTSMSFHFGTVGGVNSMTVQGFLVR